MRGAYIGILTPGSTSRMRAEWLRRHTPVWDWDWIDTDPPLVTTSRIWQSLAYRFQVGKAVDRINEAVRGSLRADNIDLAWVDKAIFLEPATMKLIRQSSRRLVHFTPDTAFHANRSRNLERSIRLFDVLVTTKSFETERYRQLVTRDTVLLTTQGYDPEVHYPRSSDGSRRNEVVFVGLAEPDRERCVAKLLEREISVRVAGYGWQDFVKRWQQAPHFKFVGESVFGSEYAAALSEAWIGLGLLSKRFPELHTTRTFEIPACGTILATESNSETRRFFENDEAIFFNGFDDLADKIQDTFTSGADSIAGLAHRGQSRVLNDHRDYPSILSAVLNDSRLRLNT
jgi:spore maturation protein CgeB